LSFNLELTDTQKHQRGQIVLPYLEAQKAEDQDVFQVNEDELEDDPDDDLEI
jgi:hypothetical protein